MREPSAWSSNVCVGWKRKVLASAAALGENRQTTSNDSSWKTPNERSANARSKKSLWRLNGASLISTFSMCGWMTVLRPPPVSSGRRPFRSHRRRDLTSGCSRSSHSKMPRLCQLVRVLKVDLELYPQFGSEPAYWSPPVAIFSWNRMAVLRYR
jgi:hypothetical protein